MCPTSTLSPIQKHLARELLFLCYEFGFDRAYSLDWLARRTGLSTSDLYDERGRLGVLWEFGPLGDGFILVTAGACPGSGFVRVSASKSDRLAYLTDFGAS